MFYSDLFHQRGFVSLFLFSFLLISPHSMGAKIAVNKENKELCLVSGSPELLHIDNLLNDALEHRSDIRAQDELIEQTLEQQAVIMSTLWPQISFTGTRQKSKNDAYPVNLFQASLDQVLLQPGGAVLQREAARYDTKVARYKKENIQDLARFEISDSYLDLRNRLYEKQYQDSLDTSSLVNYKSAQLKQKVGLYALPAFEKAEAQFKDAQSTVFSLNNTREISRQHLFTDCERIFEKPISFPDSRALLAFITESVAGYDTEELTQLAMNYRTEILMWQAQADQAEIQIDIARYFYLPTISFFANFYEQKYETPVAIPYYPWNVGISMSWTFDGGGSFHEMRIARAHHLEMLLSKKHAEFSARDDIKTAHLELQNSTESVRSLLSKTAFAETEFLKNQVSFKIGLISEVAFTQAKTAWEQARLDLEEGITFAARKHEELLYKTGYAPGPTALQHEAIHKALHRTEAVETTTTVPIETMFDAVRNEDASPNANARLQESAHLKRILETKETL
ncbi:MAG: hypothetical protein UV38_C0001G0089 [candidate division TM6 bacterium GW2011_GWE2_42_60]|nr:MAG: hypothetical protein UV38_C0001G0089 [candidate division TM6 bacterium GW2011_GWE2_42_60]HBY05714.1 hypothetical protein [Candidatus Dependentiae bacterium]